MNNKIALYLPTLNGGGAEHFMVRLANGLASKGYNIDLILASAVGPNLERVSAQVNIIDLRAGRVLLSLPKLATYIRKTKPLAIISTQNHASIVAILAGLVSKSNCKIFIRQATILNVTDKKTMRSRFLKWLFLFLAKKADLVITTSEKMKNEFLEESNINNKKVIVIPNPVSINQISELSKKEVAHPWFLSKDLPIIIAVGRLEKVKGFDNLISAFASLRENYSANVRLVILGEGKLRQNLEILAKELNVDAHIWMPGFVGNIYPYLARADVLALTSHHEGFPNVILEAMACGTNITAFNCPGGVSEILEEGKWGALIEPGNINKLSETIYSVINSTDKPNVRERAKNYSPEVVLESYSKVLP
ncbi:glycosyltransferase [Pseudoalteromonas prydzensis]|uniref:glycosyltransferase n=1 Tax=Pseudoalteromonas prydzensis TaxID=182141 RepID=UPI003FD20B3A